MEILERARGASDGDIISFNHSKKDIQEEVNRRTAKAGFTDRDGQPRISRKTSYGKGDWPRPVNKKLYDQNYDRIFRKEK